MDMNNNSSNNVAYGPEHLVKLRKIVLMLYIMFIAGFLTGGLTLIAALILGHIKKSDSVGTIYNSHIRSYLQVVWADTIAFFIVAPLAALAFFFTLSTDAGAVALVIALTAVCLLIAIALWSVYRIVKGLWCWFGVRAVN